MPVKNEIQGLPPGKFNVSSLSLVSARSFRQGVDPDIKVKCNTFIVSQCDIDGVQLAFNEEMFSNPIIVNTVPYQKLVIMKGQIEGIWVANSAGGAGKVIKYIYGNDIDITALPDTTSISIDEIGGSAITLGQKVMASSLPVVIASNQSAFAVTIANLDVALSTRASEATLTAIKDTAGIKKITDPLPAGTNNIGDVDIASALPAGNNNIGDVDIASALPAGNNNIGDVDVASEPDKNQDVTVLASQARTANTDSADQSNTKGKGLQLVIDVTAIVDTPSVVFTIQGKDVLSGKYYTLLVSAAITGVGTTVLRVYPGLTAAANLVASDILPKTWRVHAEHADADSITYSVGASVIE